jgi:hypothetical protein
MASFGLTTPSLLRGIPAACFRLALQQRIPRTSGIFIETTELKTLLE